MTQFLYVAIHHSTGRVSRMQLLVRAPADAFDTQGAEDAGFTFDHDSKEWVKELSCREINREISRSCFPKEAGRVVSWKVINKEDLPVVRGNYDAVPARMELPE
jgi:hypothetical protein